MWFKEISSVVCLKDAPKTPRLAKDLETSRVIGKACKLIQEDEDVKKSLRREK